MNYTKRPEQFKAIQWQGDISIFLVEFDLESPITFSVEQDENNESRLEVKWEDELVWTLHWRDWLVFERPQFYVLTDTEFEERFCESN